MDYASCLMRLAFCIVSAASCSVSSMLPAERDPIGMVRRQHTAHCLVGPDQMHSPPPSTRVYPDGMLQSKQKRLPANRDQGPSARDQHCLQDLLDRPKRRQKRFLMPVQVLPLYCFDPRSFGTTPFGNQKTGSLRAKFLLDSVQDLKASLR